MSGGQRNNKESARGEGQSDQRKDIDHLVYTVLFPFIGVVLSLVFLWPLNHLAALLVLAGLVIVPAIVELNRYGFSHHFIAGTAFWVIVAIGEVFLIVGPNLPDETDLHGWLMPANEPSAKTACPDHPWGLTASVEDPQKMLTIALGGSGAMIAFFRATKADSPEDIVEATNQNAAKRRVLTVGTCNAIAVRRTPDGISVDADVYSDSGKLAIQVRDNEFELIPMQIAFPKRPDRSTLIVTGTKGEELLWLRYLNHRSLKIRGYFSCEGGPVLHIGEDAMTWPVENSMKHSCFNLRKGGRGIEIR